MNKLGKYQIRRTLGKGAMGIVYEGFDPVIERTVAIKTILPSQLDGAQYAEVMARFKREAQAAGRLNHPGIVAIYDCGEEVPTDLDSEEATMMAPKAAPGPESTTPAGRIAYIAMEFVKGRELKELFAGNERFKPGDAARVMGEILDALDHAHAQGVVHRDIKPANIIVLESGRIKIADFGIARVEKSELTQTGMVLGTPSYMSPEQFMGHPVDGRSDIFSCGVVLYQMLTGEKPFTGESTTTIMYKVLREEPVPPSQINIALAPALDAVVRKALAKNPNERFQTGREFAQALQAAMAPQPAATPAQPTAAAGPPAPRATPASGPGGKTVPAGAWVAVAASFVAVAAGAYVFLGSKAPPPEPAAQSSPAPAVPAAPVAAAPAAPGAEPAEPGTMVLSALGVVDSGVVKGDAAALAAAAREDAKRQLVEKALALYVDRSSIEAHRKVIEARLLANPGSFIRNVVQEGRADAMGSLVEMPTRAVVSLRDVQRSLNQLSREERIDFIRNQGDPRVSIRIDIANDGGGALARERSQLAENVVKDRIKSFGFRVWSGDGDNPNAAQAQQADFAIRGDVRLRTMSMKLQASGLTVSKSAITSWTLKAIDTATGEEVYLSTKMPQGRSWASEDQALAEIGKLVGDEFSKNFFLSYFSYRPQRTTLLFTGLPEGGTATVLRELRSMRAVLDAQPAEGGRFAVQLPPGSATEIVQDAVLRPLNAKMGEPCFALAGASAGEVSVALAPACANPQMRSKLESGAPAGWKFTPPKTST